MAQLAYCCSMKYHGYKTAIRMNSSSYEHFAFVLDYVERFRKEHVYKETVEIEETQVYIIYILSFLYKFMLNK